MAEKIIIEVGLSSEEYEKRAKELGQSIKAIKDEQAALKKAGQETSVAYQSNAQQLRQLTQEQKAYINMAQQADGSINQLRAQLALLTQQYNRLSQEERENTEEGRLLAEAAKEVSDRLKEQESRIGDTRRNVGNYKEALQDVEKTLSDLKDKLTDQVLAYNNLTKAEQKNSQQGKELQKAIAQTKYEIATTTKELSAFQKAQKEAGDAVDEFADYEEVSSQTGKVFGDVIRSGTASVIPFGDNILSAADSAKTLSGGLLEGANASKIFKVALASTGIGLIVVAVAALLSYLGKLQPVMNAFKIVTAAVGGVFDRLGKILGDSIIPLGEKAFKNPLQFAKDLGNFVKDNLINRFKAFGVILQGISNFDFKKISNGVLQAATGVENSIEKTQKLIGDLAEAGKAAANVQDLQNKLDRDRINNIARSKELIRDEERLKNLRDDENKSIGERTRANAQAHEIEKTRLREQESLLQRQVDVYEEQAKRRGGVNKLNNDELEQLRQAQLELADVQEESAGRENEFITNRTTLQKEAIEKTKELAAAQLEADRARLDSAERIRLLTLNGRQREEAELISGFDKQIQEYRKYGATTRQLEAEKQAELSALRKKFLDEDLADNIEYQNLLAEAQLDNAGENFEKELAIKKEIIERNREFELEQIDLTETQKQIIREKYRQEEEQAEAEFRTRMYEAEAAAAQQDIDRRMQMLELEDEIQQRKIGIYNRGFSIIAGLFGKNTALAKAAFIAEKATAIASIVVQTQKAIALNRVAEQAQIASASLILPFPINIAAVAGIKAAAIAQRTQILLEGILSGAAVLGAGITGFKDGVIDFKSDGKGNMVIGPGTSRSDSINARLSDGESVINARSTKMFKPILSAINEAGGGRPLIGYTPGNAFAGGGMFESAAASSININIDPKLITDAIIEGMERSPAPRVVVDDINSVNDRRRVETANATF